MDPSQLGRQGTCVPVPEGVFAVEAARPVHSRVPGVEVLPAEGTLYRRHSGDVSGDPDPSGAVRVRLAEDWNAVGVEPQGVIEHGAGALGDEGV